ncbi:MMPL family transporter [Pasteurella atlantica]|uniref:MMPL family transporter n=2 Tax=Pasteurellaceae TaxID=712 RepID=A0ACC6HJ31_9PAST|nr:MMPL family transporter [Pasteurella atlantica]MDP8050857.1 MMPL family transporter [Pasteurella atlantica]MDP8104127.1 MMPL family transporter [Pasteurella atlantica]MDP8147513.1 MMPL family transporter [Pasteurella atlantica]
MKKKILQFSINHPKKVFWITGLITLLSLLMMFRINVDTDPENMLPHSHPARILHDEVKQRFGLADMLVVGIVNDKDRNGIYNPNSLSNLKKLSDAVMTLDGVVVEDVMSLPVSDNISQIQKEGAKAISFHYLMETPPSEQAQADQIRQWVDRLPMLQNTLVSGDNKAAGLFIPITSKDKSYQLYNQIQDIVAGFDKKGDEFYITGLPVAEDTFGVEMFLQMAISAPAAAALIFVLMLFFFRSPALVAAPMILAMATVIITMGLMIGMGFSVHIMSSMIPIFLMPIAVVDSIHVLSDFSDNYRAGKDKKVLAEECVTDLFRPMLFTSLTSLIGFLSLNTADIPPVRVFGSFVGFGIILAFILTMTFIPAYMVSLSDKTLDKMAAKLHSHDDDQSLTARVLRKMPQAVMRHSKLILSLMVAVMIVSGWGISKTVINDNPMNWFNQSHPIRQADKVLNTHFAGTYEAYISFSNTQKNDKNIEALTTPILKNAPDSVKQKWQNLIQKQPLNWSNIEDSLIEYQFSADDVEEPFWTQLQSVVAKVNQSQQVFLQPENLAYLEKVQGALQQSGLVGKSTALPDLLKVVNRELRSGEDKDFVLPLSADANAQAIMTYQSSHRPNSVWHMVTPDYQSAVIWLQLKSGDNQDMSKVVDYMDNWFAKNPTPKGLEMQWSGLTYINVVWQDAMVNGMLISLISSFVMAMLMVMFLFRSVVWGVIAMIPLSTTIMLIYGIIGWVGKNYDMPVAVLSALTLGLSVDFAIHFIERSRLHEVNKLKLDWKQGIIDVFEEPSRAIARNAIVIALGFTPLLIAPLVPYQTVGFFMAAIMAISCLATLVIIPALVYALQNKLFKRDLTY